MTARERVEQLVQTFPEVYPGAQCELNFKNPLQLLIATILSAQCTDKRVNMVTPALFAKYRKASDYAKAPPVELEKAIQSTGFFRNKTKSIRAATAKIADDYGGKVPDTMEALHGLPGVGRKTANVVLGNVRTTASDPADRSGKDRVRFNAACPASTLGYLESLVDLAWSAALLCPETGLPSMRDSAALSER